MTVEDYTIEFMKLRQELVKQQVVQDIIVPSYFLDYNLIIHQIQSINTLIDQINQKQSMTSQYHFQRALSEEILTLRQQLNQKIHAVQTLLNQFEKQNIQDFEQKQLHPFVIKQLKSQLNTALQKFNQLQQIFLTKLQNQQQQDNFTGDEEAQQVYKQGVKMIEDRNQNLLQINDSVNELTQLIGQLALQVYECGTIVDRIDQNLNEAEQYIDQGIKNLQDTIKHQNSVSKMRGCTYTLILVNYIMSIVMLTLKLAPVSKNNNNNDTE